jgi:hypothetical protein
VYKEPGVNPIPTASDQLLRLGDVTERGSAHGDEGGAPGAIGLLTKALAHHGSCPRSKACSATYLGSTTDRQMPKLKPPKMSVQNGFVETPAAQGLSVFASKEPDGGRGHAQNQNRGQFGP